MHAKGGYNNHMQTKHEQANAPDTGHTANNVSANMYHQTAEAIAQLAAATEEDCSPVSNLSETISQFVDQVANMA
eukprot:4439466-Ditylum_brightwellii.AAC.1